METPVLEVPSQGEESEQVSPPLVLQQIDSLDIADGFLKSLLFGGLLWIVLMLLPLMFYLLW
jgi:hypothetical protein